MKDLDNKNPCDYLGETPLHTAARYGQFKACQLFIKNVTNKNPKDRWGKTPLNKIGMIDCEVFNKETFGMHYNQ